MTASRRIASLGLMGAVAISLTGCGGQGLKDVLGYGKDAPDEFAIVTKAPLVIPPDFSLRPPSPGAPRPQEAAPSVSARNALVGEDTQMAALGSSAGEQTLLSAAGALDADPNIRRTINSETHSLTDKDQGFVDNMLSFRGAQEPSTHIVDAQAEARRIQSNEAQGLSVTEGDTPMTEDKGERKGFFSRIFSGIF